MSDRSSPSSSLPAVSTVLLLVALVAASLVLVSGRDLSHRLTIAACTDAGDCGAFPESPPVCEYYGRDRVVARESFAFAQQHPTEGARMIQFGDDSAEVIVESTEDTSEVYSFLRWEDAQRWLLDHSSELGQVANAAAGPAGQPIRDGYLRILQLTGLDHDADIAPVASTVLLEEPSGTDTHGVLRMNTEGDVIEVTVIMPLESATSELRTFAAEIGVWGFLSYTVELDTDMDPQRLTVGGPGAEDWSVEQLRSPSASRSAAEQDQLPSYVQEGNSVLRSFVLDLTKQSNTALYRDVFAMESVADAAVPLLTAEEWISAGERAERYVQLLERVTQDAVAVETSHSLSDDVPDEEQVMDSVAGLVMHAAAEPLPQTRLLDARSADLAISGSTLEPLLTCEERQEDVEDEDS